MMRFTHVCSLLPPGLALVAGLSGCPRSAEGQQLPPAGLAGAPGERPAAPSVHLTPGTAAVPGSLGHGAGSVHGGLPAAGNAGQPTTGHGSSGFGLEGVPNPSAASRPELEGVVAEIRDVKDYTYLRVQREDGSEDWAAVLRTSLTQGQRVRIAKELWMSDFQSSTLGRTFDRILFGRLLP